MYIRQWWCKRLRREFRIKSAKYVGMRKNVTCAIRMRSIEKILLKREIQTRDCYLITVNHLYDTTNSSMPNIVFICDFCMAKPGSYVNLN